MTHPDRLLRLLEERQWHRFGRRTRPEEWWWMDREECRTLHLDVAGPDGEPLYKGVSTVPRPDCDQLGRAQGVTVDEACRWVGH